MTTTTVGASPAPPHRSVAAPPVRRDLRRSWRIFDAMRHEQVAPEAAYSLVADDTVALLDGFCDLAGASAIDVGGGPGYTAAAMRRAGADARTVDASFDELGLHGRVRSHALVADGGRLPFVDGTIDVVVTLNAVEHVADPWGFLAELVRVARPGGTVFVAVTNWWSPWGGHETSPWHYLGGERAARRYRERTGSEAKNRFGRSLFPVHIGSLLRWAGDRPDARLVAAFPRYYPSWASGLVRVPGVREVATWNLAMVLEKR